MAQDRSASTPVAEITSAAIEFLTLQVQSAYERGRRDEREAYEQERVRERERLLDWQIALASSGRLELPGMPLLLAEQNGHDGRGMVGAEQIALLVRQTVAQLEREKAQLTLPEFGASTKSHPTHHGPLEPWDTPKGARDQIELGLKWCQQNNSWPTFETIGMGTARAARTVSSAVKFHGVPWPPTWAKGWAFFANTPRRLNQRTTSKSEDSA
jgi:hypothetical protein